MDTRVERACPTTCYQLLPSSVTSTQSPAGICRAVSSRTTYLLSAGAPQYASRGDQACRYQNMLSSSKQFPSDPVTYSALALNLGSYKTPTMSGSTMAMARYPRICDSSASTTAARPTSGGFAAETWRRNKCQDLHNQGSTHTKPPCNFISQYPMSCAWRL